MVNTSAEMLDCSLLIYRVGIYASVVGLKTPRELKMFTPVIKNCVHCKGESDWISSEVLLLLNFNESGKYICSRFYL